MAKLLKLRRGTTTQHASFTGAEGEVTIDTTKDTAVVHDGSTQGGTPLAKENMSNVSSASIAGRLGTDSIATSKIAAGALPTDVTIQRANITSSSIKNSEVAADAAIAGTKISPNFGSQSILTTGGCDTGNLTVTGQVVAKKTQEPQIVLQDADSGHTGNASETGISFRDGGGTQQGIIGFHNNGDQDLYVDTGNNGHRINFRVGGSTTQLEIPSGGINVTGNIAVTGTVDGRNVANDGSKVDGIESGATADQTKSDIDGLNINADTVDGLHASSFLRSDAGDTTSGTLGITSNASYPLNINGTDNAKIVLQGSSNPYIRFREGTTDKAYLQWHSNGVVKLGNDETGETLQIGSGANGLTYINGGNTYTVWHSGNDGASTGLDADTLDGVQGSSYARSDADDTLSGDITFTNSGQYPVVIGSSSGMHDGRLLLRGSNNPYIRFREGNTDKAYIQWNGGGFLQLTNEETNESLRIKSGTSGLKFLEGSTEHSVFHTGNDGSGSGLDADKLDGVQASSFLRSDAADTASSDISFGGGAGAITINGSSDIRMANGNWTGDYGAKFQHHDNHLYCQYGSGSFIVRNPSGNNRFTVDQSGNAVASGNVTAYSDARLKTNVNTINDALSIVGKLRGVSFDWKETGKHSIGLIAQEVEEVIPEVVTTTMDPDPNTGEEKEIKSVDYGKIVGVLINAINELKAEIEELKGGK